MGLLKTFLRTSSVHGLEHTLTIKTARGKVWLVICITGHSALLLLSILVTMSALDPENEVTKIDVDTVFVDGEIRMIIRCIELKKLESFVKYSF